jgi:hypothetical protein
MAALPAPNRAICDWEAEVVLILMMPGGPAGIGLAGGQGPAVPVAGDTFRGGRAEARAEELACSARLPVRVSAKASPGLPAGGVSWSVRGSHLRVSGSAVTPPDERSRATAHGGGLLDSRREVPAVPENIVLVMRFHPVGGEDVTVVSEDFGGEREALEAIAQALDERRSLVLTLARYGRETGHSGVILNLANVVSVRVSKTDSAATGQYL